MAFYPAWVGRMGYGSLSGSMPWLSVVAPCRGSLPRMGRMEGIAPYLAPCRGSLPRMGRMGVKAHRPL